MSGRKLLRIAVLICMLSLSAFVAGSAGASCSGSGCHGLDPVDQGCATGAYTASRTNNYLWQLGQNVTLYVDLRYSPSCVSNWSKAWTWEGWAGTRSILADIEGESGFTYILGTSNGYSSVYTNMVDGNTRQCAMGAMRSNTSPWYYGNHACG